MVDAAGKRLESLSLPASARAGHLDVTSRFLILKSGGVVNLAFHFLFTVLYQCAARPIQEYARKRLQKSRARTGGGVDKTRVQRAISRYLQASRERRHEFENNGTI